MRAEREVEGRRRFRRVGEGEGRVSRYMVAFRLRVMVDRGK